jgi:hypothetical protein
MANRPFDEYLDDYITRNLGKNIPRENIQNPSGVQFPGTQIGPFSLAERIASIPGAINERFGNRGILPEEEFIPPSGARRFGEPAAIDTRAFPDLPLAASHLPPGLRAPVSAIRLPQTTPESPPKMTAGFEGPIAPPKTAIEETPRDMVLAAGRAPYSYNPRQEDMGLYEYGGKFNGRDVWFLKPQNQNPFQQVFETLLGQYSEYLLDPRAYADRYKTSPLGGLEEVYKLMQLGTGTDAERGLKGAHAKLYEAQAGAIPSEVEERLARAKYYGRETPFVLSPGQRAFLPGREGEGAIKIAEGAEERPAAAGALERMNEFDKLQYQTAAHLAQNSLDPETQKMAFARMDEIEKKYTPKREIDKKTAFERLKSTGKYTDDQINAYLASRGLM